APYPLEDGPPNGRAGYNPVMRPSSAFGINPSIRPASTAGASAGAIYPQATGPARPSTSMDHMSQARGRPNPGINQRPGPGGSASQGYRVPASTSPGRGRGGSDT